MRQEPRECHGTEKELASRECVHQEHEGDSDCGNPLIQLSEEMPKFFNSNLSAFIHLFDSESYVLRQTITIILGNIVKLVLTESQDTDSATINQNKRKLLDILMKRLYDKNSYCRGTTVDVLSMLFNENSIPIEFLHPILKNCCERVFFK
jgi:hypothetical protein